MSAFTPERLAYMKEHINDSRATEIYWLYSVPIALSTVSTALRLWAKSAGRNGITLDDYLIVFATICLIGECASGMGYGPPHGLGRHVIAVATEDLTMVRKGDYVFSHFYDIALVSVKLGILAFYYRVFVVPVFRRFVLGTVAFVIAWGIGITVTLALVCRPVQAFWDSNIQGKCLHLVEFTYFTNITNLVTDIWIFLLPIPVIWHLQLQMKKKILLCLIFSIGLGTCIVSAVRLTVVLAHGDPDYTWTFVPLGGLSAFEPLGGLLCTNIPIIWHMWRKRRAASLPSSKPRSTTTGTAAGSGDSRRTRITRSLGLSVPEDSYNASQSRTILGTDEEGGNRWLQLSSSASNDPALKDGTSVVTTSRPSKFFSKVERHTSDAPEMTEAGSARTDADRGVEAGVDAPHQPSRGNSKKNKQGEGVRKNVWEVRRK